MTTAAQTDHLDLDPDGDDDDEVDHFTSDEAGPREGREQAYDNVGREQLGALLEYGLHPGSYLLDIGCGKLRCGRWIIPLLDPGHYCGIEPVPKRVEIGLRRNVPAEILALKKPRFDHNADFDFTVFGVQFTHFVARSIWSHASKGQIEQMLDGMVAAGAPGAVFLASFRPTSEGRANDYMGDEWKGRSHESAEPGIVAHSVEWIDRACESRGLVFELSSRRPVKEKGQVWAVVHKPAEGESPADMKAAKAQRQIVHNLNMLKFAVDEYTQAVEKSTNELSARKAKKAMKALRADAKRLGELLGIDPKELLGA